MWDITIRTEFSAAHQLRNYNGKCEQLHGHNWEVEITLRCRELDHRGIAIDFKDLKTTAAGVLDELDHTLLNETGPFRQINPSAENIARHIFQSLKNRLQEPGCRVHRVTVFESSRSSAAYLEDEND